MVELAHFYNEVNALGTYANSSPAQFQNAVDTGSNPARIAGSSLTANTKYLIVARALFGSNVNNLTREVRVQTDDYPSIEILSEGQYEFEDIATGSFASYLFIRSFETSGSPADIEFQCRKLASTPAKISHTSLLLLDLDAIADRDSYGFDASDAGPTDSSGAWTNDSNAFDGSTSTFALNQATLGELTGDGTTAPTSGANLGSVRARVEYSINSTAGDGAVEFNVYEDSAAGTQLLNAVLLETSGKEWSPWFTVDSPSGGWTWAKLNDLSVGFDATNTSGSKEIYRAEIEVVHGDNPYFEDAQGASGDELAVDPGVTTLAQLDGRDLGSAEYLALGSASVGIGSTGRWFRTLLATTQDSSAAAFDQEHQAEGEDTTELRNSGFAARHKDDAGTDNIRLGGMEESGNGNMTDEGAYLIALPTAIFADFEFDFIAADIDVGANNESTVASVGPYTPSVNGNHLIFGRVQNLDGQDNTINTKLHVEEGTTEIRTGDQGVGHSQRWDTAKAFEFANTFQRYSISSEVTLNLRASRGINTREVRDRWLIVVNLNPPSTGPPPLVAPRKQLTTVRL